MKTLLSVLLGVLLAGTVAQAQYTYITTNGTITITGYTGPGGAVVIPATINGLPVTRIGLPAPAVSVVSTPFLAAPSLRVASGNWPGVTSVTIPHGVVSLGPAPFGDCLSLTNVGIPDSITNMGSPPFYTCPALTAILVDKNNPDYSSLDGVMFNKQQTTLIECPEAISGSYTAPNSVTTLGIGAFSGCMGLTGIVLPDRVISIGSNAFVDCTNLTGITIPRSVASIGTGAFEYCTSLKAILVDKSNPDYSSVDGVLFDKRQTMLIQYPWGRFGNYTIPGGVSCIGTNGFAFCAGLTSVTIPESVTSLGFGAFSTCTSLTNVVLPHHVIQIGGNAFMFCSLLTNVTIPDSVTSIGDGAFQYCTKLSSVTIGSGVNNLAFDAFNGCYNLAAITVKPGNPAYSSVNGVLFDENQTTLIQYPAASSAGIYTIPGSVTQIVALAFQYCDGLTSLTIPGGVTSIGTGTFEACSSLTGIMIPVGVTSIGNEALAGCSSLTGITIPDTVTNLGNEAFEGCSSLTNATFGNGVSSIGDGALEYCANLISVFFQGNAPDADSVVFLGDPQATAYYLPGTSGWGATFAGIPAVMLNPPVQAGSLQVTLTPTGAIAAGAQWQVDGGNLQSSGATVLGLSVGSHAVSYTAVGGWAAPGSQIVSVSDNSTAMVSGVYVQECPFLYTNINGTIIITGYTGAGGAVVIPATINGLPVTGIGGAQVSSGFPGAPGLSYWRGAFEDCTNLTSVTIPQGVASLGTNAFFGCPKLVSASIPASVTNIGPGVFGDCDALTAISVAANNPNYSSVAGVLFDKHQTTLIQYPEGLAGSYTIPGSVTCIGDYAFAQYPAPAFSISPIVPVSPILPIRPIGFPLPPIIASTNPPIVIITNRPIIFTNLPIVLTNIVIVENPLMVAHSASDTKIESDAPGLTGVGIPAGVTNIGTGAFARCTGLSTIVLPEHLITLGNDAFEGCTNLTVITIPRSVVSIGTGAFADCSSLTAITVESGNSDYSSAGGVLFNGRQTTLLQYPGGRLGNYSIPYGVASIGTNAFGQCAGLTGVTIPGSVTSLGTGAFSFCTSLTNVVLPGRLTQLGDEAFNDCTGLLSVTLGGSVTNLGVMEFAFCTNLVSILIPNSVTSLGEGAFQGCTSLTGVALPNGLTSIGELAFEGCSGLTDITLPASLTSIGNGAFSSTSLGSITVPDGVTSLGDDAFSGCGSLTNVSLGNRLTNLGADVFAGCSSLTSITIPAGITSIGDGAFEDCTSLTNVTIPGSVSRIGDEAFESCSSLTTVTIPDGVTSIGTNAFYSCGNLTSVTLPNSVTSVGDGAFQFCGSLTNVLLGSGVTNLAADAFNDCYDLVAITVDPGNPAYSSVAGVLFDKNQTTLIQCPGALTGNYTIPGNVTQIAAGAFQFCAALTSVTIPDGITNLDDRLFFDCENLTNVTIPASVTRIGNEVFDYCYRLASVTIPAGVTSLGTNAFTGCSSLTAITVDPSNPAFRSVDGVVFDENQTTLIQYPGGLFGSCVIPDGVTTIAAWAFTDCSSLTSITIPGSVTSLGDAAFSDCASLTSIYFQGNAPGVGSEVFDSDDNATVYYEAGASGWGSPFAGLPAVLLNSPTGSLQVTITPSGVPVWNGQWQVDGGIGRYSGETVSGLATGTHTVSFSSVSGWITPANQTVSVIANSTNTVTGVYVSQNQSPFLYVTNNGAITITGYTGSDEIVTIPATISGLPVTGLGDEAFYDCTNLSSVAIPNSITNLGSGVFDFCTNLTAITVDAHNSFFASEGGVLFNKRLTTLLQCPWGKTGSYTIPNGVTDIGPNAFDECTGLTNLLFPDTVTTIEGAGFAGMTGLIQVTLPNSLITLGSNAFANCTSLARVVLPNRLVTVGDDAFSECTGLTNAVIGSHVTSLGIMAFFDCASLTSVTFGNSVTNIGDNAFDECGSLTSITLPNQITRIGGAAFADCSSLTRITLPNHLTGLEPFVFYGCRSLAGIALPNGIKNIGDDAFYGCAGLTSLTFPNTVTNLGNYAFAACTGLSDLIIPNSVTQIGSAAFSNCSSLTNVIIGNGVIQLGEYAFAVCQNLGSVYFQGDAPAADPWVFINDSNPVVYYLPGTRGWGTTFAGVPAVMWIGSLQVTITPAAAANAGAEWRVNGGAYHASGTTVTNLSPGNVTVSFKPISGWTAPVGQRAVIAAGQTTAVTATYLDDLKPTLAVVTPQAGRLTVSDATFTVAGTAGDNAGVAGVWYQLNGGGWTLAATTNNWTNWWATLSLTPGNNTFRVYAMDSNSRQFLYVGDSYNSLIRKITPAGLVSTLAGDIYDLTNNASVSNEGYADGLGGLAQFNYPAGTAVDGAGNVYVADYFNSLIRKITPAGLVTTLAGDIYDLTNGGYSGSGGNDPNAGYANGRGTGAKFKYPTGIAADAGGNVYVADSNNSLIRKITPAGLVTTLAGDTNDASPNNAGYADGPGGAARFNFPGSLAVDGSGNVYVADTGNNLIRKITPAGLVTTLAGDAQDLISQSAYNGGYADGPGGAAMFDQPFGTAVDLAGNVYVSDTGNNLIRKITPAGVVTTLAGDIYDLTNTGSYGATAATYYNSQFADGPSGVATFNAPTGIAADAFGNVFVADNDHYLIRKITPDGATTTVAGDVYDLTNGVNNAGYADGPGDAAKFNIFNPSGLAVDGGGGNYSPTNTVTIFMEVPRPTVTVTSP